MLLLFLTAWRLWVAGVVPIVQDEAYYLFWARRLAWGYFDHPPLVAFLAATANLARGSAFVARLGVVLSGCIVCALTASFMKSVGFTDWRIRLSAVLFALFNLLALAGGDLITPDAGLCLGWIIAMHETLAALKGAERRWVSAGAGVGLALLAKLSAVLFLPVALIAIVKTRPRALGTPWPYLGALVAACMFLPNVMWNAQHDWVAVRFQLAHGLGRAHDERGTTALPPPEEAAAGSAEERLAAVFGQKPSTARAPGSGPGAIVRSLKRASGYWLAQLGLWGSFAVLWVVAAWPRVRKRPAPFAGWARHVEPRARPLVLAATLVPLLFCAALSINARVEANWPAMYMLGGAVWLASQVGARWRIVLVAALFNVAFVSLAALHAAHPMLALGRDRILAETHGFRELADVVSGLEGPVSAESYQLVSMLRFYSAHDSIFQWPGIMRDSELTRPGQTLAPAPAPSELVRGRQFWLVTDAGALRAFPPFSASRLIEVRDCGVGGVQITDADSAGPFTPRCEPGVHVWYVTNYVLADGGDGGRGHGGPRH